MAISVLIPAYNAALRLPETLASVEALERIPDKVILVDDGSTDETYDIASDWARRTALDAVAIRQENGGVSAARNAALAACKTELAAFLDADDILLPHHLGTLARPFEADPDLVLAFGDQQEFTSDGDFPHTFHAGKAFLRLPYEERQGFRYPTADLFPVLLRGNFISTSASMVRLSAVRRAGSFDVSLRTSEDREFYLRLIRCGPAAYCADVLARKRMHAGSLTETEGDLNVVRNSIALVARVSAMPERYGVDPEAAGACAAVLRNEAEILFYGCSKMGIRSLADGRDWLRGVTDVDIVPSLRDWVRSARFSLSRRRY
ncbi:MAG: glycosyltransferase family A protein [Rhodospirillaceae bacterium]